jgi:hypothetical protein
MSSSLRVVLILVVVVALGGVAFYFMSQPKNGGTETPTTQGETETTPTPEPTPEPEPEPEPEPTQEPTPEPTPEPETEPTWSPEENWWLETHIPVYSMVPTALPIPPQGQHSAEYYWAVMENCTVTYASWFDKIWEAVVDTRYQDYITEAHERGIYVLGTESMITVYPTATEPESLSASRIIDPWGNAVKSNFGISGVELRYVHSMLHTEWQDYLIANMEKSIDAGVDGFLIDDLPYGSIYEIDFNPNTVALFREHLKALPEAEKATLAAQWGITDWETFDYAKLVRDTYPGRTQITTTEWQSWDFRQGFPLYNEFQRFLRLQNREAAKTLILTIKAYALEKYNRTLPFTCNVNDLTSPEGFLVADLVDQIDLECTYSKFKYFPNTRAAPSVKMAEALGKKGYALTSLETRGDVKQRGEEKTLNLYRVMIADGFASGGAFYVEEGAHGISLNVEGMEAYYRFPSENAELFTLQAAEDVCVLQLWESLDAYNQKAYQGLCNLLTDAGYQYGVVLAAEEYTTSSGKQEYPAPDYPLTSDDLASYESVIIPELKDVTAAHADAIIRYAEAGGKLFVFVDDASLTNIESARGTDPTVMGLIGYLRSGEAVAGGGRIIRINGIWGTSYADDVTSDMVLTLRGLLTGKGVQPAVKATGGKTVGSYLYEGTGSVAVHIVNYAYKQDTDTITPVENLSLEVTLPAELVGKQLIAIYKSPGADDVAIIFTLEDGVLKATIPRLDVWGVLLIESQQVA